MKKSIALLLLAAVSFFLLAAKINLDTTTHKYIGTKACVCHNMAAKGKQVEVWQKTKHAAAYKALALDTADKIAKAKGYDKPAKEVPECLGCHVTGFGKDVEKTYSKEEGVTCEACHGPASAWKPLHNKPGKLTEAIDSGFVITRISEPVDKEKPEGMSKVEEHCRTCHNEKSPTFKEFRFADMWKQIAHPMPKAEK